MMSMMDERNTAQDFVAPYQAVLVAAFRAAEGRLTRVKTDLPMDAVLMKPRTWASMMADFLYAEIEMRFASDPKASFIYKNGYVALALDGKMVMRFKKFGNTGLRCRYTPTQAALDYFELQQSLIEAPGSTNTVAGYISDRAGNPIGWYLTCPKASGNKWSFEIGNLEEGGLALPPSGTSPKAPVVKPKDGLVRKPEEQSGV